MNLGRESEVLEFKRSTNELDKAIIDISSMLNKFGHGTVLFGVASDGEVIGEPISSSTMNDIAIRINDKISPRIYPSIKEETYEGRKIIRVDFSGQEKPYSANGRYYKRVFDRTEEMTPSELRQMISDTDISSLWGSHLTPYGIEAVDKDALFKFYSKAIAAGRIEEMAKYDEKDLLISLGLMFNDKLNNAGFYLFSDKKPVVLKAAVFVTDERLSFSDISRFEGNIYNLMDKGCQYIKEHMNWRVTGISGTSRIEVPDIPVDAIREIVVNAFAHADYRGITEHEIDITPTVVEVYNPGEFPSGLTPERFATERIKSMPRNRIILNTLYKSKDVEVFGSGLRKAYALCSESGNRCECISGNGGFSFIFHRERNEIISKERIIDLNKTDSYVLEIIRYNPTCNREFIAERIGKSVRTVQRSLITLTENGYIKRVGSNKTGHWETEE